MSSDSLRAIPFESSRSRLTIYARMCRASIRGYKNAFSRRLEAEITRHIAAAATDRTAWNELIEAYNILRERRQPVPSILQRWIGDVATGKCLAPKRPGRKRKDGEYFQIAMEVERLKRAGLKTVPAYQKIGKSLNKSPKTIGTAHQRYRRRLQLL